MQLERLYKTSATGATQIIDMNITGDTYTRSWGQLNGKQQSKSTTAVGKNIGRSNETTPEEQAVIEAKAVWVKKQKANYSTSQSAPTAVKLPMKVNKYQDHIKKIIFPAYVSVKLNGVNAEYRLIDEKLVLLSRGGEEYPIPEHQREEAITLMKHLGTTSLNGEMYVHGEFLQDIMAATKKHNELTPKLKFWVFDFPEIEGSYSHRCNYAYNRVACDDIHVPSFPLVNVGLANSHAEIDELHEQAIDGGYEGLIIRNAKGLYEYNKRSLDVFKYKIAQDAEFEVTGFKLDKNQHAVYELVTPLGGTFSCKRRGTAEERLKDAQEAPSNIGKHLKVEYEMMSKGSEKKPPVPQKPVGLMFRAVDANGEAVE